MVVNFKAREISRGAHKLARTSMLIKKNIYEKNIDLKLIFYNTKPFLIFYFILFFLGVKYLKAHLAL
jgi:hypothetical protein